MLTSFNKITYGIFLRKKPLDLPMNTKRKTRKQNQCTGGASKLFKSRIIKKIQQTK